MKKCNHDNGDPIILLNVEPSLQRNLRRHKTQTS